MDRVLPIQTSHCSFRYNFEVLTLAVLNNLDYFYFRRDKYWYSEKFISSLQLVLDHIQWYEVNVRKLCESVDRFDISKHVLGNGFRSFDIILERYFSECYRFSKELSLARDSMFFMGSVFLRRLQEHIAVLDGLKPGLVHLLKMMDENSSDQPLVINKHVTAEELIREYGLLNQVGFYGSCQGFYFCNSMRKTLQGVSVIMASFSDLYQKSGGPFSRAISAVLNGIKYIVYPESRAQQIVNVAQNASVEFVKAFWSLSETHFMKELPKWICPKLEVLEEVWVPAEPVVIKTEDGSKTVIVPVPSSHIPPAPVRCLLMSSVQRIGQVIKGKSKPAIVPPSPALLFHCHGGGFVSQTPESHEIYLRHWAHDLKIPILSVDYSLAPRAPFPRALEEVLLVYVWALKNCDKLGWTGEKICFVGDSAGGNILMGIVIKTISMKIRRPDAILCAYTPLILDLVPSPSRLLCWLDPLLPFGFMLSCLDAYVGAMHTDDDEYTVSSKKSSSRQRKLSSISEILDSSLSFLKESEWTEVEPNEPEARDVNAQARTVTQDYFSSYVAEVSKVNLEQQSLEKSDYVKNFVKQHSCDPELREGKLDDSIEHLLFNFPHDLVFDVKQKCNVWLSTCAEKVTEVVEQNKFFKMFISPLIPSSDCQPKVKSSLCASGSSIAEKIRRLKLVTSNPYISPLLVSNDVLKEMPPIYFVSLNFDPCLDDSITFAKRMEAVGKPVVLDMLDGLPHGFLNFLPFSKEAHNGSDLCVRRIKEALSLQD